MGRAEAEVERNWQREVGMPKVKVEVGRKSETGRAQLER